MGVPLEKVDDLIQATSMQPISFRTPVGDDGDSELCELIEDETSRTVEEEVAEIMLKDALRETMASLLLRERRVIELRYGLNGGHAKTLEEIGTQFGLTRERIRQIERKALATLRHPSRSRMLKDYLDQHRETDKKNRRQ